jgi:hypothetical protein
MPSLQAIKAGREGVGTRLCLTMAFQKGMNRDNRYGEPGGSFRSTMVQMYTINPEALTL